MEKTNRQQNITSSADDIRENNPLMNAPHSRAFLSSIQGGGSNPYVNFSAHLYTDPWDKEGKRKGGEPLYKSLGGRVTTRLISRGLFGATFMTLGSVAVRTWDPHEAVEDMRLMHKGMTYLARGFDTIFGTPIKAVFGEEAVTFRSKKTFSNTRIKEAFDKVGKGEAVPVSYINGRSLGQEMVGVSFDFAAGSFGDAMGRELVSVADPNYHTDWLKDGHVNFSALAKSAGKSLWRMVSYNQMEDWAAALPYVYQMRGQRHLLGKAWPGAKFTLDHQNNGGSFVVDEEGNIKGSYMKAGALDLQARFMGYNFYTLMFRDVYNHAALKLADWKKDGYAVHMSMPEHPLHAVEHGVDETVKYVAKSFIKSMAYMAPAVPFFWMFRTPISRSNGMFVSDIDGGGVVVKGRTTGVTRGEDGISYVKIKSDGEQQLRTTLSEDLFTVGDHITGDWREGVLHHKGEPMELYLHGDKITPEYLKKGFDPYHKKYTFGKFDALLNPLGQFTRATSQMLDKHIFEPFTNTKFFSNYVAETPYLKKMAEEYPGVLNRYNLANTYVNAAMSYTPYMIAKYETANHMDTPLFDAAAYRFLDGIDTLKWKDIKEGAHDMASVVVRGPISEGTIQATCHPRGPVNSSFESTFRDVKHQEELRLERHGKSNTKEKDSALRPGGWTAYEKARMQEKSAPEGVTIH